MVGSVEARIRRVKDLKEVVSRMSLKKADRRKMRHLEREAGMRQEVSPRMIRVERKQGWSRMGGRQLTSRIVQPRARERHCDISWK
jgi:hypothetical protein